ncbi:MAG: type VI secretion system baseplate subunit TssK [Candidatus Competibacteraceae bacterium]
MSWNCKVVWSEGMFLRPQHFQQQDRYIEALIRDRCRPLRSYGWGIETVSLDQEALALGKLAVAICRGTLPDGTPFNIPYDDDPPPPVDIDAHWRNMRVLLALPLKRAGSAEVDREETPHTSARYRAVATEARDNNAGFDSSVPLEIGKRRLRLIPDRGDHREYATLGIARVVEKRPDQMLVLDEDYIAPCLDCRGESVLVGFISEILGLLHQRGEALAARVSMSGRGGVAEVANFLLLQVVNRFEPLFAHLSTMSGLHPEDFYRIGLQLAGELSVFTSKTRRPISFPAYQHDDLQGTFAPLIQDLRQALSLVFEQNAIQLPLQERKYGIRVSPITDRGLLKSASFVLAVNAEVPAEILRGRFPTQAKVGTVENIRELVNLQLPGIRLNPLPVAPRQIPYHAGSVYFELDRNSEYWKPLDTSGGFAFHVGEEFPGIEMAFWAIKEESR